MTTYQVGFQFDMFVCNYMNLAAGILEALTGLKVGASKVRLPLPVRGPNCMICSSSKVLALVGLSSAIWISRVAWLPARTPPSRMVELPFSGEVV